LNIIVLIKFTNRGAKVAILAGLEILIFHDNADPKISLLIYNTFFTKFGYLKQLL